MCKLFAQEIDADMETLIVKVLPPSQSLCSIFGLVLFPEFSNTVVVLFVLMHFESKTTQSPKKSLGLGFLFLSFSQTYYVTLNKLVTYLVHMSFSKWN